MTPRMTRRALAAGLSLAPFLSRPVHADLSAMEAAAKKEGRVTWYIAQVDTETAEAMGRAFTKRYPEISVAVMRTTGQVAYQRVLSDLKNKAPQCDVLSTTDISHFPALIERKAVAKFVPENAKGLAPAFQGLGEDGYYYPTSGTVYVLGYNTKMVKAEDAPKRWTDVLEPKWKRQFATAHPAYSGYNGILTLALKKLYGWSYFEKLAKNEPLIGRSGIDPVTMMTAGERSIGAAPVSVALRAQDKGNPIGLSYPEDGCVLCIGPSGVLADAPHPNAARLFMEWLLGPEFAALAAEARSDPVRSDVPPKPGAKPLSEVKLLRLTTEEIGKGLPEVIEEWRDTFGN